MNYEKERKTLESINDDAEGHDAVVSYS